KVEQVLYIHSFTFETDEPLDLD
ncbi:MAG: hypothetical protein K0Q55_781, partial [Verrucomicrobia bacterium]|nr:hypothetical protein [Verrucomicrobiota bacterium]